MTCASCDDKGLIQWRDPEHPEDAPDYCVCLCPAAAWFRSDENAGKRTGFYGWQVWAYQHAIEPTRVFLLEDVLSPEELTAKGFRAPQAAGAADREAALLAAGRSRKGPKL